MDWQGIAAFLLALSTVGTALFGVVKYVNDRQDKIRDDLQEKMQEQIDNLTHIVTGHQKVIEKQERLIAAYQHHVHQLEIAMTKAGVPFEAFKPSSYLLGDK